MVTKLGRSVQDHQGYLQNSYMVEMLQGERLSKAINGRYLKKYYPACGKMHEDGDVR